jgi:hypothetical protein
VTGSPKWLRYDAATGRVWLTLHAQPNARTSAFTGVHGDALKVKIAAPAVDNKANAALIEFLSETLELPRSAVTIRQGASGRRKLVEIAGGPELVTRIRKYE